VLKGTLHACVHAQEVRAQEYVPRPAKLGLGATPNALLAKPPKKHIKQARLPSFDPPHSPGLLHFLQLASASRRAPLRCPDCCADLWALSAIAVGFARYCTCYAE
jgi:hypothetical protein